jgi:hypothetical protein
MATLIAQTLQGWPIPFVTVWWHQAIVVVFALAVLLTTSGRVVLYLVGVPTHAEETARRFDAGAIIGKSENILVFLFIMSGQFSGLALIVGAKTIARLEAIKRDASYYLGGTLVNIVWSVIISMAAHLIMFGPIGGE